ncbi:MAG: hypothetical protein P4L84_22735 [Isosphaeraceae bacterium]|nr:hypothetical protein [Isosphaeraceae bacterium]
MSAEEAPKRPRRERSARYPGASLEESLGFCEAIDRLGLDELSAEAIADGLGYSSIKTNTFSARLSAARQFGLLSLDGGGYGLTPLARSLLHPSDPADVPRLRREALLKPPLYEELVDRLGGKRVPEASILGNILYHHHQITARAKQAAAEVFLESSRFAGALGADEIFRAAGAPPAPPPGAPSPPARPVEASRSRSDDVRLDLRLWDEDEGKVIRVRAPRSITAASFERFLQAFRLVVRVDDRSRPGSGG